MILGYVPTSSTELLCTESQVKAAAASCVDCIETAYDTAVSKATTSLPLNGLVEEVLYKA